MEGYDITITSVTGTKSYQRRISRRKVVIGLALLGALTLVILVSLVSLGHLLHQATRTRSLSAENVRLRRQLVRLAELEGRIEQLDASRRSLLRLAGVDEIEEAPSLASHEAQVVPAGAIYKLAEPDSVVTDTELEQIRHVLRHMPIEGPVSRSFGRLGSSGVFHTGTDLAGETGAAILAAGEGVVSFVGFDETFGHVLVISHNTRLATMYGHNSSILVRLGDSVASGQRIADVGSTGLSSAPHLHFEVQWNGKAIDPAIVFPELRHGLALAERGTGGEASEQTAGE